MEARVFHARQSNSPGTTHPQFMLFVIDFDGTLAVNDSVDALLERFAPAEWRSVEQQWLDGRITAMACMREQIRMVRADHVQLEAFFRGVQLDASFIPFLRHVRAFADVAIVSDGLDHVVRVASKAAGLPELPVYANRLHFVPRGLDLSFPHQDADCASALGGRLLGDQAVGPYIDLIVWQSAASFGHANRLLAGALKRQIGALPQLASQSLHRGKVELAELICPGIEKKHGVKGRVHFNVG